MTFDFVRKSMNHIWLYLKMYVYYSWKKELKVTYREHILSTAVVMCYGLFGAPHSKNDIEKLERIQRKGVGKQGK